MEFNFLPWWGNAPGSSTRTRPHVLRHSCGYALADKGADARLIQDYLGHCDLRHTARYTRTAVKLFDGLWE